MRAGKLRHRIELQSVGRAKADDGQSIETFTTYATVWADIKPMRGAEAIEAQQQSGQNWFKITVRYNASINIKDRIAFKSRVFEVNYALDFEERKIFQELTCTEIV
ncbi:hypothetical protein LCGC14_2868490 [marine sediment metagenome]|uniref:Phage head-tail adaptor n=1 Tax=marine sediment metagenome TaxID=412755 RepID=A0A0F8YQD9_9ZZZZ